MLPNHRVDTKVLQTQYAKMLRAAILTGNFTEFLDTSLQYYLYDFYYVTYGENIRQFRKCRQTRQGDACHFEEGKTYLVACVGNYNEDYREPPYTTVIDDEDYELSLGTVVKAEQTKATGVASMGSLCVVYEIEYNESLDDAPPMKNIRQFISPPSWTNHFPTADNT